MIFSVMAGYFTIEMIVPMVYCFKTGSKNVSFALIAYLVIVFLSSIQVWMFFKRTENMVGIDGHFLVDAPLDDNLIDKLPTFVFEPYLHLRAQECTICLVKFEEGDVLKNLPSCNHTFHT